MILKDKMKEVIEIIDIGVIEGYQNEYMCECSVV
jgi:hypothetical protein